LEASLIGQSILILEDEPLIAHDIAESFKRAGASVVSAQSCSAAIQALEANKFSAAILDGMIGEAELHQRLTAAGVPYMVYSGYVQVAGATGTHVSKPPSREALLIAIKALIDAHAAT
jgi:DNA-binding response OmpR family regulator